MPQQRADAKGRNFGTLSILVSLQASYIVSERRRVTASKATFKIRGRKSRINTVTIEACCWTESKLWVYSGRQMVLHTHKHTHTGTLNQIYGGVLLQDPPRSIPQ